MPTIKLMTMWLGEHGLPPWVPRFQTQMQRFRNVHWELLQPPTHCRSRERQLSWLNQTMGSSLGISCCKQDFWGVCEFRPVWGKVFAEKYRGYDYWGWCDLDILFGDLDRLLPPLLEDCDVLHFKEAYLSGCFAILRNVPEVVDLYQTGDWKKILSDPRYHVWDESGHHFFPGESFYRLIQASPLRMKSAPDLHLYETVEEPRPIRLDQGRLYDLQTEKEALFLHFMTDIWPLKNDGTSRWL